VNENNIILVFGILVPSFLECEAVGLGSPTDSRNLRIAGSRKIWVGKVVGSRFCPLIHALDVLEFEPEGSRAELDSMPLGRKRRPPRKYKGGRGRGKAGAVGRRYGLGGAEVLIHARNRWKIFLELLRKKSFKPIDPMVSGFLCISWCSYLVIVPFYDNPPAVTYTSAAKDDFDVAVFHENVLWIYLGN